MLRFIFGKPMTGKTYTVIQKIKELCQSKKEAVLIVPEQASFEAEKNILKELGDSSALYVECASFTRLYDMIGKKIGGIAGTVLKDSHKIVFMNKAIKSVAEDLKLWGKYKNSIRFSKTVLDTVGEMKINSVTPEMLRETAEELETSTLREKLFDLALIYETYDLLLGEKFIDPADILTKVYENLKNFEFFKGKTVFIDSFKGFTGQQYKIIERILCQAEDVYISITNDPENTEEYSVFSNIRRAVLKIQNIAKSRGVKLADPILLTENYYKKREVSSAVSVIADEKPIETNCEDCVTVVNCKTDFDEAEFTAGEIRRLVREEGYRFKDFAVISRDSDKYATAFRSACKRNGVNAFFDRKITLSEFPFSVAAKSAVEALNFSTESLLAFHKTGLGSLSFDEISVLENYAFVWGLNGKDWFKEWDMNPEGLTDREIDIKGQKLLAEINRLRIKAIEPIVDFKNNFGDSGINKATAIIKLFDGCEMSKKLNLLSREYNEICDSFYADAIKTAYDTFMEILDSLVLCFGDAYVSTKEFYDALCLTLSLESVGVIPQTLDEVVFGSADRIRPSKPKVTFILGANQGEFPKNVANAGVFTLKDRKILVEKEIGISDNCLQSAINENFLVYSNLSLASDKLYISYYDSTLSGEEKQPSAFVGEITDKLKVSRVSYPNTNIIPETKQSAFREFCRNLRVNPEIAISFKNALAGTEFAYNTEIISHGEVRRNDRLTKETAEKLYGRDIYMSATKLDTFNRCHFSFFCRYGLNAERLKSADFNVLQRGTIVHYCLERLINDHKKSVGELSDDELFALCDGYIEEYLSNVKGFNTVKNAKTDFIIGRISRSLKEVFISIRDEMKQSDFEPVACELKIGKDGVIPHIRFNYGEGDILINGSIDRVDSYNGYIRIIDYKTGSKSFKMPDILFGLNLQMLLYLYSIVRGGKFPASKAGGILYKPSKRDLNGNSLAMNGLLPADMELVRAMDKEMEGEFVPKFSLTKAGTPKKSSSYINGEDFESIFDYLEKCMAETGIKISSGDIAVSPINGRESEACKYCEYSHICGIEDSFIPTVEKMSNEDVLNTIKEDNNAD